MTATLFTPWQLRSVRFKNRIMISPMAQYSAHEGYASPWHSAYVAKLAQGGAGSVMLEVSAVEKRGRTTYGDIGIWDDAQIAGLRGLATLIESNGSVPAIQIGHGGRKASCQRPWHGMGPLGAEDLAERGELPWECVGPTDERMDERYGPLRAFTTAELDGLVEAFAAGACRAVSAGFKLIEVHMAHGYLLHSFLSPLVNTRTDGYGGDFAGRIRLPLRVVSAVRQAIGDELPLSVRISAVDGLEGGWTMDDSVAFSRELKQVGVDIVDCSSGGIYGSATNPNIRVNITRGPGYQVPFADRIRREVGMPTIAVGLITEARQAEAVIAEGRADIVAIGRQALYEPNWPLHVAHELGVDPAFDLWPPQHGWWLARRAGIAPPPLAVLKK